MSTLPVTSVFAGLAAIALAYLGLRVAYYRMRAKIAYGDQDDRVLRRRVRAHGNFIEYVPIGLIALALIELNGAPKWQVWVLGAALALARIAHAAGLSTGVMGLRAPGATLTFIVLAVSGALLLWQVL
jgi:uncharacterized membrane protein YecN with MAPEG domain